MRFRVPLAALILTAAAVATTSTPASAVALTACTASVSNNRIYATNGGIGNPTTSYLTVDVSESLVTPADYYIHILDGNGHSWTSEMQTSSFLKNTPAFGWSQWLDLATDGTVFTLDAPLEVTAIVHGFATPGGGSSKCSATITLMPDVAPSAPGSVSVTPGNGSATVSWTPAKNFTGQTFTVTAAPGGKTCTVDYPSTSCTVEELTNGATYSFTVTTTTSGGTSSASDPATGTPTTGGGGGGGGGELPETGSTSTWLLGAALLMIATGSTLLRSGRRRRTA